MAISRRKRGVAHLPRATTDVALYSCALIGPRDARVLLTAASRNDRLAHAIARWLETRSVGSPSACLCCDASFAEADVPAFVTLMPALKVTAIAIAVAGLCESCSEQPSGVIFNATASCLGFRQIEMSREMSSHHRARTVAGQAAGMIDEPRVPAMRHDRQRQGTMSEPIWIRQDRRWFRSRQTRSYRLRRPFPGEATAQRAALARRPKPDLRRDQPRHPDHGESRR